MATATLGTSPSLHVGPPVRVHVSSAFSTGAGAVAEDDVEASSIVGCFSTHPVQKKSRTADTASCMRIGLASSSKDNAQLSEPPATSRASKTEIETDLTAKRPGPQRRQPGQARSSGWFPGSSRWRGG